MRNFEFWKWIFLSLIATPFALLLGLDSGGAGHGNYILAAILFPYTLLSTAVSGTIKAAFVGVAVVQFPVYGVILAFAGGRRSFVAMALACLHITAVALCFLLASDNFIN
jgi:hypothetical protein